MSIQQNFPSTRPSLNLNFARSQKLDPRITFTRTSSATRVNGDGLIEVVPANSPRFDFDPISGESLGLLVEEARSNLITYSEDFRDFDTSITWENFGINVELNSTTSPDGKLNGTKLINTAGTASRRVNSPLLTVTSGVTYTHSVWLKAGEYTTATVFCNTTAVNPNFNNLSARINLVTGVVSGTINTPITVISYPNGWWRISSTFTTDENTATTGLLSIVPNTDAGGVNSVVGDGTSGIYIWGAQLEQGSFPTSYIPTTTSTVTRTADNASITGSNFSDFYNPSEGTVYCEANPGTVVAQRVVCDFGSNALHRITYVKGTNGNAFLFVNNNNNTQASIQFGPWTTNGKLCGSYKLNDFAASFNGSAVGIDTDGILPDGVNKMDIGKRADGSNYLNGHIKNISYYPSRLSNQVLQTLTK
jgi:hypothetical protein